MLVDKSDTNTKLDEKTLRVVLQSLFNRMNQIDMQCQNGQFPLYSVNDNDHWTLSKGGSWTGGFWAGCWWLRSLVTGSTEDERKALSLCQHLNGKLMTDSINRSMIFGYGTALGAQVAHSPYAKRMAYTATDALIDSYHASLKFIPIGKAMGGGEMGDKTLSIDTLSSLLQLCHYSNNKRATRVAINHLNTAITACFNDDGSWYDKKRHDGSRFIHSGEKGAWARGHAWGLLGLSRAAFYWGEPYTSKAVKALDYWNNRFLSKTGFAIDKPSHSTSQLYDASAMLIVALATSILSSVKYNQNFSEYRKKTLHDIIHSQYYLYRDKDNTSIFYGSSFNVEKSKTIMAETPWGIYFLMLTIAIELQELDTAHI